MMIYATTDDGLKLTAITEAASCLIVFWSSSGTLEREREEMWCGVVRYYYARLMGKPHIPNDCGLITGCQGL